MTLKEVLDRCYAKEIYEFALKNSYADKKLLTQKLLNSRILPEKYSLMMSDLDEDDDYFEYPSSRDKCLEYYYYCFARDVDGADIDLLQKAFLQKTIIDPSDEYYIYLFARDVDGANIELLQQKMECASPKVIYSFAKDVDEANVELLQKYLIDQITEGYDFEFYEEFNEYVIKFAKDIKNADINKMIFDIKKFIDDYHANGNVYHHELGDFNLDLYIKRLSSLIEELNDIKKRKNNTMIRSLKALT